MNKPNLNTILNAILIDIVEIIIVKSDDYHSFKTLKNFVIKLKNKNLKTRIKDKLTKVIYNKNSLSYNLNNKYDRQYDRPSFIDNHAVYYYLNGNPSRMNDTPATCYSGGSRYWRKNGHYHRENNLPTGISYDYSMEWKINGSNRRNEHLPIEINIYGDRSYEDVNVTVFDYI